jgi:hypothetical protein
MFGFGGIGLKIAIAAILFSVISGGYFYIKQQQAELELAKEVQAKMEGVIQKQGLAMDNMKADVERMGQVQTELSSKVNEAQRENQDLAKKFTQDAEGKERNLSAMAQEKPSIVEEKINRGSKDALRCNELITGAPLTEEEAAGKVRNNICPTLLPKPEVKKK